MNVPLSLCVVRVEDCLRWPTSLRRGWPRRAGKWRRSRPPSSPAPSPASSSPKTPPMNRRKGYWSASMNNPNPSPAGTPENSPAIHRWGIARKRNESRQGRKRIAASPNAFFRPSGAWSSLRWPPTVETVGYGRPSLTGLRNPCSSVKSVVKQEIVLRVEGFSALADQRDERLAKPRGQV